MNDAAPAGDDMPKRLTSEQRAAKRHAWLNSPRSLNGRIFQLEHDLLERCIRRGLGVKGIARLLHISPVRVRYLLKKHGLTLRSQRAAAAFNEHNARLHAEKAARRAKTPAPTGDSLSRLAYRAGLCSLEELSEEGRRVIEAEDQKSAQRAATAVNETRPESTRGKPSVKTHVANVLDSGEHVVSTVQLEIRQLRTLG